MLSIEEFAAMLERAAVKTKVEIEIPVEAVMVAAENLAKESVGTYAFGWPQLAESTQDERVAKGYSANDPLLREGDLRDSIEHQVEATFEGAEGTLGSSSMVALYQELGTSRNLPPRPFLSEALMRSAPLLETEFGEFLIRTLK
jgi:hypothetical protein